MPPLPPIDKICRSAVSGTIGATDWSNIFHWRFQDPVNGANTLELANAIFSAYTAHVMYNVADDFTMTSVIVEDLSTTPVIGGAAGGSSPGMLGVNSLEAGTCMLVKHLIARRYRGGHPRTYLPGGGDAQRADADRWTSAYAGGQTTGFNAFVNAVLATTFTSNSLLSIGSVSYYTGHAVRVTPLFDDFVASSAEVAMATQRRRLGR